MYLQAGTVLSGRVGAGFPPRTTYRVGNID